MNFPNYFDDGAVAYFEHFLADREIKMALQIGVMTGDVTRWLAKRYPNALLVDVDPWSAEVYDPKYAEEDASAALSMDYEAFFDYYLSRRPDNVLTYRQRSDEFFAGQGEFDFDFIYIDGCHTYEACLNDLGGALVMSHKGTLIAVDDYNFESVKKACDEFAGAGFVNVLPRFDPAGAEITTVYDSATAITRTAQGCQQWFEVPAT